MKHQKTYLGDGLYADFDGFQIALSAENGIEAHDTVYLDDRVLIAFLRYTEKVYGVTITVEEREETESEDAGQD